MTSRSKYRNPLINTRFGKSTHISMISNSVTHLRSYVNSAIANIAGIWPGNSAPIPPVTPRDRRRLRIELPYRRIGNPPRDRRRLRTERRRLRIERRYRRITSALSPTSLSQTQTSPHRAPTSQHRAPISSHRMTIVRVFHDVSQCFKSVS